MESNSSFESCRISSAGDRGLSHQPCNPCHERWERSVQSGPVMSWHWKESGDPRQKEIIAWERKQTHSQSDWRVGRWMGAPSGGLVLSQPVVWTWQGSIGAAAGELSGGSCFEKNVHFRKASLPNFLGVLVIFEGSFGTPHFIEALYLIKIFLSYKLWCPERHLNAW